MQNNTGKNVFQKTKCISNNSKNVCVFLRKFYTKKQKLFSEHPNKLGILPIESSCFHRISTALILSINVILNLYRICFEKAFIVIQLVMFLDFFFTN